MVQQQLESNKNSSAKILYCAIEAGVKNGWHEYICSDGIFFCMNSFGASAKAPDLYQHFNLTAEKIAEDLLKKNINIIVDLNLQKLIKLK